MIARNITFYLAPQFSMVSLLPLTEVLRKANEISGETLYSCHFVSEFATVEAVNGMAVSTATDLPRDSKLAAVIVCASYRYHDAYSLRLAHWLRWLDAHEVALGAADTGIFLCKRAKVRWSAPLCTHWPTRPALQEEWPNAEISDRFFEYTPHRFSSAGATSGLDMMLHLVGEHHGKGFAARVGSHLIFGGKTDRSENQLSPLADYSSRINDPSLQRILQLMEQSSRPKQQVHVFAEAVGMSQSQLNRLCKRLLGETPVRIYQISRLRRAHALLKSTILSIEVIAFECGFASRSQFTSAFKTEFSKAPSTVRGGYR
ncbi:MAG: helix-turn-helix domain-containing protein [Gammaproteobacteria bacterium]|nr:helix-turn-helix domain-containing protein [Gammaproteobacteria bacterium]